MITTVDPQELLTQATGANGQDGPVSLFMQDLAHILISDTSEVSPWWSRQRDSQLRSMWKDGNHGSALMFLAQTKLATIPMTIVPRDNTIAQHVRQAQIMNNYFLYNSGFGTGWYQTMMKFTEDYLGQDNGGFMEVLGDGQPGGPIEGMPVGVRHLDSSRCTRTGDPVYPVVYTGDDNKRYKMHFSRVFFMSQMPSAIETMHGVGYCSVSRSLRIIRNLLHIVNHKDEKMGARAASQILVGSGITGKEIIKTIAAAESMMRSLNLEHHAKTIAIGSTDGSVSLNKIDLNNFDPYDEETSNTFAAYAIALAWGLEFQEVIPIQGTRQSEIIALQRSRSKLPHLYTTAFMQQAAMKLVPEHLELRLDFQDDQADQQRAIIEDITSRNFERQMSSGVTTPEVVQQILYDRGYLTKGQLHSMQLSRSMLDNGIPVQSIFFDNRYDAYLTIDRKYLLVRESDIEAALTAIEANEVLVYTLIGGTRSADSLTKAKEALSALAWLKKQYQRAQFESLEEDTTEQPEDAAQEDTMIAERRGAGEGGSGQEEQAKARPISQWFLKNHELIFNEY